ncbi:hypothetical protein PPACK8108_LOCUS17577 [Phakopsora pachyrhizi]|uniref:Uncharacterized protein n=1 Tax=Phakopsora pachyrhizi TaxID=170000 RepID=A0AAV0BB44_PHAPC|nr:hypothetical protein PPACK8108_LOCUS17577 [Phakopsora pachyrhizi]
MVLTLYSIANIYYWARDMATHQEGWRTQWICLYLKGVSNGKVRCLLADPPGSVLYSYIKSGRKLIDRTGSSITEGI